MNEFTSPEYESSPDAAMDIESYEYPELVDTKTLLLKCTVRRIMLWQAERREKARWDNLRARLEAERAEE